MNHSIKFECVLLKYPSKSLQVEKSHTWADILALFLILTHSAGL